MAEPVSRETGPPAPPEAQLLLAADRLRLAERYAGWLVTAGVTRGLIGPREGERVWQRHLLNCVAVADAVPHGVTLADVGSGAGLPGVALAIARPDVRVTLVEPLLRRTTFLEEVVADLGLDNCVVRRGRAEELHSGSTFDVVTARAVAPLGRLLRWSMPLVGPSGVLLAMKGATAAEEIEAAATELRSLGCGVPEVLSLGTGVIDPPTTVVRVARRTGRG